MFKPAAASGKNGERVGVIVALLCAAGFATALLLKISIGMTIMLSAFLGLFGLILHDMAGRRRWEATISATIQMLSRNHDRLVREVARNRDDIHILKDGLADTSVAVEAQGKKMAAKTDSIEAQMFKTIAEQLGNLGTKHKPSTQAAPRAANDILELQVAPPPPKAPPQSRLDDAISPASKIKQPSEAITRELIRQAIDNNMVDLYLQPVVRLPQRQPAMVEAFARLRLNPNLTLQAHDYMAQARKEFAVPAIDNLLLHRCFSFLRERGKGAATGVAFMMNISGAALGDSGFMNDLVAWIARNRALAPRLILEMTQSDLYSLNNSLVPVLNGLSQLGCRFSIDNIRQRQIDVAFLKSRHIRYLKMDAQWLLKEGQAPGGYSRIVRLKRQLDAAGIDLIVEKIEREQTLKEILDFGIDYGQGYLFGKPDRAAAFAAAPITAIKSPRPTTKPQQARA